MSVNSKMTALADEIRALNGSNSALSLDAMKSEVGSANAAVLTQSDLITQIANNIASTNAEIDVQSALIEEIARVLADKSNSGGGGYVELLAHADIPAYVKQGVLELVDKINNVRKNDSIVFLAMSDNHHYGKQANSDATPDSSGIQTSTSNLHATMAAKALAYIMNFDFMAHLGDITWGGKTTTSNLLWSQMDEVFNWLDESHRGIPCFHAIGNHDTGIYYHEQMVKDGYTGVYTESGSDLYNAFTSLSASNNTVFGDISHGGYCYRDFTDKKLRVFLLNTSEKLINEQKDQGTYGVQRVWFANALLDLNSKSDADKWSFVVLSHYPADYGATMPLSELFKAYVDGTSFTIKDPVSSYYAGDNTNQTVDFTGKNKAKFIAQFHGHVHNFLTSKLYSYATGSGVQYDAQRVAIPNGQFARENYYTTVGTYTDISFAQDTTYIKTAGTVNDTSFVVNVINPSEQLIYSFCYGAGIDRVISYSSTPYYAINYNLTNVTMKRGVTSVAEGSSLTDDLITNDGYELTSVKVTMGGVDITSQCYSSDIISIGNVTGDIVITAVASVVASYKNWLPISTDASGAVYNGSGYKENTYLSGGSEGTKSGVYCSGFIPCKKNDVLRFLNCGIQNSQSNHRFALYDANKTFITNGQFTTAQLSSWTGIVANFGSDGNMTDMTLGHSYCNNMAYIRFCCSYLGADSVVTVNEEIK